MNARQARKIRAGVNAANRLLKHAGRAPQRIAGITTELPPGLPGRALEERLTRALSPYRYGGDHGAAAAGFALFNPAGSPLIGMRRAPCPARYPRQEFAPAIGYLPAVLHHGEVILKGGSVA